MGSRRICKPGCDLAPFLPFSERRSDYCTDNLQGGNAEVEHQSTMEIEG
jgi:hypothetical protein